MEEFGGSFLSNDFKGINLGKKRKYCSICFIINIFLIIVIACLIIFILVQNRQEKGGIEPTKEEEEKEDEYNDFYDILSKEELIKARNTLNNLII